MKKNIFWSLLALIIVLSSCEKKEWPLSDIKQVPVYNISSVVRTSPFVAGYSIPFTLEVYKEKPLMIEYVNAKLLKPLATTMYVDASNETDFNVSFKATEIAKTTLGKDTVLNRRYEMNGVKATLSGTMKIVFYTKTDSVVQSFTMKFAESMVYN